MAAVSLAIIGKDSEPLYIREFFNERSTHHDSIKSEEDLFGLPPTEGSTQDEADLSKSVHCSLRQQFILHASLDRFEQLAGPTPGYAWRSQGVSGSDAMFVGLLCPIEDLRVYGKCIRLCSDDGLSTDTVDFLSLKAGARISFRVQAT
jgi:Sedlin, N-terminal conserved region